MFWKLFSVTRENKIKFSKKKFYAVKNISENLFVRKFFLAHNHRRVIEVEEVCPERAEHEAVVLR